MQMGNTIESSEIECRGIDTAEAAFSDIVFYLGVDWDMSYRRDMTRAMAKILEPSGSKVLCVNRPVTPMVTLIKHTGKLLNYLRRFDHLEQKGANLFVYTPYTLSHDYISRYIPGLSWINRQLLSRELNQVMSRTGFHSPGRVAWVYAPIQLNYLGLVRETIAIYECYDENAEQPGATAQSREKYHSLEKRLAASVDLVFATSTKLVEAKRTYNPNIYFFPEAADFTLFSRAAEPATPIPEVMKNLSHPVIGFIGVLNERVDLGLLRHLAEERPQWTLAFIGPQQRNSLTKSAAFASFKNLPNVKFLGWLPRDEMPNYAKAFDVGIIPYRTDYAFNQYVNSLKLCEYTAMGKPVVSTDIPGVKSYSDIIKIAKNRDEFMPLIEESLRGDSPEKVATRLQRAKQESWDNRVKQMLEVIVNTYKKQGCR